MRESIAQLRWLLVVIQCYNTTVMQPSPTTTRPTRDARSWMFTARRRSDERVNVVEGGASGGIREARPLHRLVSEMAVHLDVSSARALQVTRNPDSIGNDVHRVHQQ